MLSGINLEPFFSSSGVIRWRDCLWCSFWWWWTRGMSWEV